MSAKLKILQDARDSKLLNSALILCVTEVVVLIGAILLELVLDRRFVLITRINAVSWLVCGAGSIVLAIIGFVTGPKRSAAISVVALCIVIFILCAFRFALV
jgi:hypothetical protein